MNPRWKPESPEVSCVGLFTAVGIASSMETNCILHSSGDVTCRNRFNDERSATYGWMDAIDLSVGGSHACVVRANGNVACWGVEGRFEVEPYSGGDAVGVAAGYYHTCVLTAVGNVLCNGDPRYAAHGEYEGGDAVGVATQGSHTCILLANATVTCRGAWGSPSSRESVASLRGGAELCVVYTAGSAECGIAGGWRTHYDGDDAVTASAYHRDLCVVTTSGNVRCVGENRYGYHDPYDAGDAVSVVVGSHHVCILLVRGDVVCRGPAWRQNADDYTGLADVPHLDASIPGCTTASCYRDASVDRADAQTSHLLDHARLAAYRSDHRLLAALEVAATELAAAGVIVVWLANHVASSPRTLEMAYEGATAYAYDSAHDQRVAVTTVADRLFETSGDIRMITFDHARQEIERSDDVYEWGIGIVMTVDDDICRQWNGHDCP